MTFCSSAMQRCCSIIPAILRHRCRTTMISRKLCCSTLSSDQSILSLLLLSTLIMAIRAAPLPFDRNQYPSIDLRLLDWPLAQRTPVLSGSDHYIPLDCYTELDRSFVGPNVIYRLNNTNQLNHRACMIRIPTGTRLTVHRMHTRSRKSYVTAMTGSSQMFMPVWTGHIHQDQPDLYGPWHVPCQQAYLVFSSESAELEWVEFRLTEETAEDRRLANPADCAPEGAVVNHADLEYNYQHRQHGR